jgi:hypothetical protein
VFVIYNYLGFVFVTSTTIHFFYALALGSSILSLRLYHKCMVCAGQIDEECYRLDNGISDKWCEWRDDLQKHMVECFEIHQKKR